MCMSHWHDLGERATGGYKAAPRICRASAVAQTAAVPSAGAVVASDAIDHCGPGATRGKYFASWLSHISKLLFDAGSDGCVACDETGVSQRVAERDRFDVAYLFVIQAFLAAIVVTQAAASQAQNPDLPFVICSSQHDTANGPTSDDPHADCCLVCTVASAATAIAPLIVTFLLVLEVPVAPIEFCADNLASLIPAKPDGSGLSRAPPTTM